MATLDTTTNAGQLIASASGGKRRPGDRIFSNLSVIAGIAVLVILAGVAVFLAIEAAPALNATAAELPDGDSVIGCLAPLVFGTLLAATLAIIIAVPLAVAVALFISHIAPRRLAQPLGYMVDLLAAIPSIVYGLWGIAVLGPASVAACQWLADHCSFIPFFEGPASATAEMIGMIITASTSEATIIVRPVAEAGPSKKGMKLQ